MPLNDHNRHFLWALPDSIKKEDLLGLELASLKAVRVLYFSKRRDMFSLTAKMPNGAEYTHLHGGTKETFIDFVLPMLNRLQIRLFHPADSVALSNWGLSTKIQGSIPDSKPTGLQAPS